MKQFDDRIRFNRGKTTIENKRTRDDNTEHRDDFCRPCQSCAGRLEAFDDMLGALRLAKRCLADFFDIGMTARSTADLEGVRAGIRAAIAKATGKGE